MAVKSITEKHLDNLFFENQQKNQLKTKKQRAREAKILKKLRRENEKVYQLRRQETFDFALVAIGEIIPHCIGVLIEKDYPVRKNEEEFYLNFNHFSNLLGALIGLDEVATIKSRTDFIKFKYLFFKMKPELENFNKSKKALTEENFTLEMYHLTKFLNEACYMFEKKANLALKKKAV